MFDKVKPKGSNLYRGEIPFFLAGNKKNVVYLCSSKRNMNDYYWMLKDFYNGIVIKPEESNDSDYINFNYEIIEAINKNQNFIVLVTLEIFLKEYQYSGNRIQLEVGKKFDIKELVKKFDSNEYNRNYLIENRMEYSLRGDILDFFPINGEHPVRVEFFDDLIDRISFFDIESQRSIEKKESIELYMDNNKHDISNFLELFNGKIKESEMNYFIENREVLKYKLDEIIFAAPANKEENLRARFEVGAKDFSEISIKYFSSEEILVYRDFAEIKKLSEKKKIIICSDEELRYREIFQHATNINFEKYPLYEGFKNNNILYLSDRELKGIRVKRDKKGKTEIKHHDISQIKEGDYIIHENFGVGIYQGLEIINHEEYLIIKYADEDRLFVSTNNLSKIERFIVEPGKVPDVFRLGRKGFRNKREKIKEDLMIFAREIVAVQAKRNSHTGFMFGKDGLMQEEFEDGFPFTLTRDQVKAIEDVKRDMESGKVMDRIICGDVGCGKTEVAIRAAFKCVADGKQVAIMVPTTVLAQQHFERFEERFKNYPFNVELMSRLKTSREISECIKRIAQGSTDIIIGTHKILSDEIKFKDLGLVIIDEEQKFGVKSKEKLKQLQNNVDMLTLTATPIPRTLNLALLGIRDISTIETLPENRLPI
ncbi:MAG: DEAD/DEAH box helicase, partial [Fusobacteriaceae bacterium]